MKTKRVGTISMALVLILFGIILLLSQFAIISAFELFIKLWPFILIILGLEILYYAYVSKEEVKIRYDIFSIVTVIFILVINIAIYGLMETGAMDLIKIKVEREIRYDENR